MSDTGVPATDSIAETGESGDPNDPRIIHQQDKIVHANGAFLSLISPSPQAVIGKRVQQFVVDEDWPALHRQFEQVASESVPALGLTVRLITGERTQDAVSVSSALIWDGETAIQTTFLPLSGAPMPETDMFASAMDDAPVGISIADATAEDYPLIYVSDGFEAITGYSRAEVLGRNCRFLQGENTREQPVAKMRAAIENRESVTVTLRNYRNDGTMFWNRVTISPVRDTNGNVAQFLGYQENVTGQKIREEERNLFKQHAEATEHAMIVTDREGNIEYVNPAFERMTGYTASEALGENPRLLKSTQQDEPFYRELWETITAGELWESELTNRRKSGELYRVRQRIVPVVNEYDEITHFVAVEYDISETKFTDQAFEVMNRVLRHNVRNSINVIDVYAELLAEELAASEHRAAARLIRKHATALEQMSEKATLIQELLSHRNSSQSVSVNSVRTYVEQCQSTHPEAEISVSVEHPGDERIKSGALLELAIEEAIENAVVHSDQSPPTVDVRISHAADSHALCIDIADTGPGIPDSEWNVIDVGRETPLYHGTGLGLWLMYWAITALGGTISRAENDPRGTVISYRIPVDSSGS